MKKKYLLDLISFLFILLFCYTGLMKIIDNPRFDWALHKSPLLYQMAPVLAWLIPILEFGICILLIIPKTRRIGLLSALLLMSIFTIYVGFMLYFRTDRPCTCGGIIQNMNWHQHLYFNTIFTLLAFLGLKLETSSKKNNHLIKATCAV